MKKANSQQRRSKRSSSRQSTRKHSSPPPESRSPAVELERYYRALTKCIADFQTLNAIASFPSLGELFPRPSSDSNEVENWSPFNAVASKLWNDTSSLLPRIREITGMFVKLKKLQQAPSDQEWSAVRSVHNTIQRAGLPADKALQSCQDAWEGRDPTKADQIPGLAFSPVERVLLKKWSLEEVAYAVLAVIVGKQSTYDVANFLRMNQHAFEKLVLRFSCSGVMGLAAIWRGAKWLRESSPLTSLHCEWLREVCEAGLV
ncbi:hypothetical protein ACXR0O_25010 [Verrucomicrobiota bacterium sgz303538]